MARKGFVRPRFEVPSYNSYKASSDEKFYKSPFFWICMGVVVVCLVFVILLGTETITIE